MTTTPRTDAVRDLINADALSDDISTWLDLSRQLEMENAILCDFINREMKMTGSDPRVLELEKRIAALSNGEVRHGGPDGSK